MMERKEEKIPFFTVWFAMEKKKMIERTFWWLPFKTVLLTTHKVRWKENRWYTLLLDTRTKRS